MRKEVIASVLVLAIGIVLVLIFVSLSGIKQISLSPELSNLPSNCSNYSMQILWESIMKEPFADVIIKTNNAVTQGYCENIEAIKYSGLAGYDKSWYVNFWLIPATNRSYIDYGYFEIVDTSNNLTLNASDYQSYHAANFAGYLFSYLGRISRNRTEAVNTTQKAIDESNFYFKLNSGDSQKWTESGIQFSFAEGLQENGDRLTINKNLTRDEGQLARNLSLLSPPACIPNWTARNTTCASDDRKTQYSVDLNSCGTAAAANATYRCDSNNDGIIGNASSMTSRISLTLYINYSSNISRIFREIQKVQLRADGNDIVDFSWNFSAPLDLDSISVGRQGSSASRGHTLVRGINANKKVLVNRIANSTEICVKNAEVSSIDELSSNCTASSESIIDCPDLTGVIKCNITGNYLQVDGLTNSAVREFVSAPTLSINCTPSWSICFNWSVCVNGQQSRICNDTNRCNSSALSRTETRGCITPVTCSVLWNCSSWMPEKCPKNETQTQICRDRNSCNTTAGSTKTETRTCEYKPSIDFAWILMIAVILILIAVVIIAIIYLLRRRQSYLSVKPPATQFGFVSFRPSPGPGQGYYK